MKASCHGIATLFYIGKRDCTLYSLTIRNRIKYESVLSPHFIHFIDCNNYLFKKSNGCGTLVAFMKKGCKWKIGFLLAMNNFIYIAECTKSCCFFYSVDARVNRFSDFFGIVSTFSIRDVISKNLFILFLNQLNGYHPFNSSAIGMGEVSSSFDGCINCNALGPDCIADFSVLYEDPLTRTALAQFTLLRVFHTQYKRRLVIGERYDFTNILLIIVFVF